MPDIVTSSCVGPTPPVVKTKLNLSENAATSCPMISTSSGIVAIFCTSTPSRRSSVQRKYELVSWVLPERTSFPIITMPAVFTIVLFCTQSHECRQPSHRLRRRNDGCKKNGAGLVRSFECLGLSFRFKLRTKIDNYLRTFGLTVRYRTRCSSESSGTWDWSKRNGTSG